MKLDIAIATSKGVLKMTTLKMHGKGRSEVLSLVPKAIPRLYASLPNASNCLNSC